MEAMKTTAADKEADYFGLGTVSAVLAYKDDMQILTGKEQRSRQEGAITRAYIITLEISQKLW